MYPGKDNVKIVQKIASPENAAPTMQTRSSNRLNIHLNMMNRVACRAYQIGREIGGNKRWSWLTMVPLGTTA